MKTVLTTLLLLTLFISPVSAAEFTGTLQQIQKSGTIKIGFRPTQPPMSFADKDGQPDGYSIDICKRIVTKVEKTVDRKLSVEYVAISADNRFAALTDNKIDLLCGATTRTLSRGEIVDFTQLTFVTGASFMTLSDTNIANNFAGKRIGVETDTTTAAALQEVLNETGTKAQIVLFDASTEGLKALLEKKIDAYAADQIVLIGLAIASGAPEKFNVLPELFSYEPFALAVRRNDADFRLVADRVISELYRSREILDIYDKWIGKFTNQRPSAFEALVKLNALPE